VAVLTTATETPWRLKDVFGKIEKKPGKLDDPNSRKQALLEMKPDACIHLAWYTEPGKYLDSPENLPSLMTSLDLFSELTQTGCKQIVATGTCAEYAASADPLTEDSPTNPATFYAQSKLQCLLLGRQVAEFAKVPFAWGRIFYPYGPMEDERRVVPALIKTLLKGEPFPATTGDQVRDYIHVEDVASAFCLMAEKQADGVFNIASGTPVTVRQLLETVGKLVGKGELIQFGAKQPYAWEPPALTGENKRLKALGWNPTYTLEKGLEQTVEWFKANSKP
jgi:UDP-glucuronate decarboxylase